MGGVVDVEAKVPVFRERAVEAVVHYADQFQYSFTEGEVACVTYFLVVHSATVSV